MKYSKPITTVLLMTAMLPIAPVSANPENSIKQAKQNHTQKNKHQVPELFDDFGVIQSANKALPVKAVKGKKRSVNVKMDLLAEESLKLTLVNDVVVTVIRDRLIDKVKGSTTWIGHVEDELDSAVFLTGRGKTLSGTVRIGTDLYEINLATNGLHEITQIDPSKNPDFEDDTKTVDNLFIENEQTNTVTTFDPLIANAEISTGTIIDVMIVYTPQSRINASGQSGIEAKIVNAVAKANQAYINSQIDMQLNLVHMAEVHYTESGTMSTSLSDVRGASDGKMDEVHSLRNQYGADQVVLITADTSACGIGYIMSNPSASFASYAFSVVHDDSKYACLSNHTLAHELGHNQGDHHDSANASSSGAYDYSYGYRLCQTGGFRTVMSYSCSGGTRVGQFSNPNVLYNGEYTGTSTDDNARSMTNTKSIVAAFRGTIDISTPNAPSGFSASALSDTEISISWADNANNETGFRLERSADNTSWFEIASVGSNIRSFTDTGLVSETTYWYRVRAYNSNGNSTYSNVSSATTQLSVTETCITNAPSLTIVPNTLYSQAGATVTYNISLGNQDSSICGSTTFTLTTSEGSTLGYYSLNAGSSTDTNWITTAPLIDGSYTNIVSVSATAHNNVSKSAVIIVDGTAPTAPGSLSATIKRKSQVAVSWNASTDSGSGFAHYIVKRNGVAITTTTRTSFTDKPGSGNFIYTVDAFDKIGNAQGNSTSITVGSSSGGGSKGKGRKKETL